MTKRCSGRKTIRTWSTARSRCVRSRSCRGGSHCSKKSEGGSTKFAGVLLRTSSFFLQSMLFGFCGSGGVECSHGYRRSCFSEHPLYGFAECFWFDGFLQEVLGARLQGRGDVFLVSDGRDHQDAGLGILAQDSAGGFDAAHL